MTKYCPHGHPLEEWMTDCPYCPKADEGIRVVLGSPGPTVASHDATTEMNPPAGPKATVVDGFTEFYHSPLKATIADTEPARKTVMVGQHAAAPKPAGGPLPLIGWLVVMNGPAKWQDFRIDQEKMVIGSGEECEVRLQDEAVSGRHASVRKQVEGLFIVDLDSTNGTFLNNDPQPLAKKLLQDEDLIKVGGTYRKSRRF